MSSPINNIISQMTATNIKIQLYSKNKKLGTLMFADTSLKMLQYKFKTSEEYLSILY